MSDIFESIMTGLSEAVEDSKSQKKALPRRVVSVIPPKEYSSRQVKEIRKSTGMSQSIFDSYLGVSVKTVGGIELLLFCITYSQSAHNYILATCLGLLV